MDSGSIAPPEATAGDDIPQATTPASPSTTSAPADATDADPNAQPKASEKGKGKRVTLSLHQKAIVKTFCDQEIERCQVRSEFVPSHDTLRQEIAKKFGWEVGRSTLSKIMSLDWDQLQLHSHPNPSMRRNRKPLFPAFEADLIKALRTYLINHGATAEPKAPDVPALVVQGLTLPSEPKTSPPILTEAIILEEAQRLKQQHGIKDEELVLSVGWLARFKHRNGIRLRKASSAQGESLGAGLGTSSIDPSAHVYKRMKLSTTAGSAHGFDFAASTSILDAGKAYHVASPLEDLAATCSIKTVEGDQQDGVEFVPQAQLNAVPVQVQQFTCPHCPLSLPCGIEGLDVVVVGYNCIRDAFVAAALVGEKGSVTCIESNVGALLMGQNFVESYTTVTLGYSASNLQLLNVQTGLTHPGLVNNKDVVIVNCAFCSIAHKSKILQMAFNWLKEGGECRLSYVSSPRRLPMSQPLPRPQSAATSNLGPTAAAIYVEDFRRLCQYVGFLDPRCSSIRKFDTVAATHAQTPSPQSLDLTVRACRLFKLRLIEDRPEDYGEHATYLGGLAGTNADVYRLDADFSFERNVRVPIDCNTSQILRLSWLKRAFSVEGDRSTHRGRFTPSHTL